MKIDPSILTSTITARFAPRADAAARLDDLTARTLVDDPAPPGADRVADGPAPTAAADDATEKAPFARILAKAKQNMTRLADKLVASTFLVPMLAQMRSDPLRSEMFHGGFGENAFAAQLDTHLADDIAEHARLPVARTLAEHFTRWLKDDPQRALRASRIRIDALG